MAIKKEFVVIFLAVVLLALAGCDRQPQTVTSGFIGGTNGIATSLSIESVQANEVLDAGLENFNINIQLDNLGEYPVKQNEILATITGVDYRSFSLNPASQKNIEPVNKIRVDQGQQLEGGTVILSYPAQFVDDLPVDQVYDIGANVCYRYQTGATSSLCLRKDATRRGEPNDKCNVDDQLVVGSSAGPVQVTSITQRPTGSNEITFTLTFQNSGTGDVYLPNFVSTSSECLDKPDAKNRFEVSISFPQNRPPVSCPALNDGNSGTLQLIDGKTTLSCKVDTSAEQTTTFTRSPNIRVDYVYKDTVSTQLTVKNAA